MAQTETKKPPSTILVLGGFFVSLNAFRA